MSYYFGTDLLAICFDDKDYYSLNHTVTLVPKFAIRKLEHGYKVS